MSSSTLSLLFSALIGLLIVDCVACISASFPPNLHAVLRTAGFSDDEIQQVRQGKILKAVRKSPNEREIVLSFACLLHGMSPQECTQLFLTAEKYDVIDATTSGYGILQEGCPKGLERLKLEPKASKWADKYVKAKPGTELNLSQDEIDSFNELQETSGDNRIKAVEKQIRQNLMKRFEAFRKEGLKGILPYARGNGETLNPADELLSHKTKLMAMIEKESPAFHRHIYEYPNHPPEGLEESFSWYNLNADGTPTYLLSHRMGLLHDDVYLLSERIFYNSCILNCVQSTGTAFPVEDGTALVFSMRASTDMITGFGGSAKRALGTKVMGSTMMEQLERMRQLS